MQKFFQIRIFHHQISKFMKIVKNEIFYYSHITKIAILTFTATYNLKHVEKTKQECNLLVSS